VSRLALVVLVLFLSACARPDPEQEAVQQQETARAILDSALEYSARGRSGDAIRLLRRAAAITPLDPVIHYDLGNSLARQGRLDEAAESYRRTISLKPDYAAAYYNLASVRSAAGRHQEAEELMAHSIEADRGYHPAHKALAQLRERRGDYEGAIESLEIAVGIKPDDVEARNQLGFLLGKQRRPQAAEAILRRTLQIDSTHADTWAHLGALQLAARDFARARQHLERATRLNAYHTEAHFSLANCLMRLGEKESGREMLRRFEMLRSIDTEIVKYRDAIRNDPADASLHQALGLLYSKRGETDRAIQAYRQAIWRDTGFAAAHNNLGNLLLQQNRHQEAAQAYRAALLADSDYAFAHNGIGTLNLLAGDAPAAVASFERAVALDSASLEFADNLTSARTLLQHTKEGIE
jgi:Tfp pilus assembly protein PilF